VKQAVVVAIMGIILGGGVPPAVVGAAPVCAPQRLRVVDLATIPELVQLDQLARAGKPVQLWKVTLKSLEDCLTVLEVRERDRIVGRSVPYQIKSGEFPYTVIADANYRFQIQEHCLRVLINVADAWAPVSPIDAQKLFCARYRPQPPPGGWSLK
jgi:hypothetical protein